MDRRILLLLIFGLAQIVQSNPQRDQNSITKSNDPTKAKIMKQINKVNDDGSYTFGYEADDGSFRVETRSKDGVVKGKYGFVDASGNLKVTEYTAGEKAPKGEDEEDSEESIEPTQSSDQFTAAQTPSAKIARPTTNNYEDNGENINEAQQKYSTLPENAHETADEEDYRAFGPAPQAPGQQLTRRQLGPAGPAPQRDQGQFFPSQAPPSREQFGGGPRFAPIDFNEQQQFDRPGPQGGVFNGAPDPQFNGPQQFGGLQAFAPAGPQQYSTPLLRQQQQQQQQQPQPQRPAFGGQSQFEGRQAQGFGRVPASSFQSAPQDFGSIGRLEEPQQQIFGGGPGQQFAGFGPAGPAPGSGRQFGGGAIRQLSSPSTSGANPGGREQYVPNFELDGFSEDADQDGFIDNRPGQFAEGKAAQAAEKQGVVKTPEGQKVGTTSGDYQPQALGPQGVLQRGRPQQGQNEFSFLPQSPDGGPLTEEQFIQLYQQSPQYQNQFQGENPQFAGNPQFQGGNPQFQGGFPPQGGRQQQPGQQPQQYFGQGQPQEQFSGFPQGQPLIQPSQRAGPQQFLPQQQLQGGIQQGIPQGVPQGVPQAGPQGVPQGILQGAPQFQGGIPQQQFQGELSQQQFGGFGGQQPQQFAPQQGGQIPPQYLQRNPQQQQQPQQQQRPFQSQGFPFDFNPYGGGPPGGPGGFHVQAAPQLGGFPGSPQQGAFPGGSPIQGQQIPQQFLQQSQQGQPGLGGPGAGSQLSRAGPEAPKESAEAPKST